MYVSASWCSTGLLTNGASNIVCQTRIWRREYFQLPVWFRLNSYILHAHSTERNPDAHSQRKKLIARGYSQQTVLGIEGDVDKKVQVLSEQLAAAAETGAVDIYPLIHLFSFDTVCMQYTLFYHVKVTESWQTSDNLLFGQDPMALEVGGDNTVMSYFRAWKPIFPYVSFFHWKDRDRLLMPDPDLQGGRKNFRPWSRPNHLDRLSSFPDYHDLAYIFQELLGIISERSSHGNR